MEERGEELLEEPIPRHDEEVQPVGDLQKFIWNDVFSFTRKDVPPHGAWQATCKHHAPTRSASGTGWTYCTRTLSNDGPSEADQQLTLCKLKTWCVAPVTLRPDKIIGDRFAHKKVKQQDLQLLSDADLEAALLELQKAEPVG